MFQDDWDTPKNGDFVRYIERLTAEQNQQLPASAPMVQTTTATATAAPPPRAPGQTPSPEARRAEAERRRQLEAQAQTILERSSQRARADADADAEAPQAPRLGLRHVFMVFLLMGAFDAVLEGLVPASFGAVLPLLLALLLTWAWFSWQRRLAQERQD